MSDMDLEMKKAFMDYLDKDGYDMLKDQDAALPEQMGDFYVVGKCLTRYYGPGGDVTIPEGFTRIGSGVFQDCKGAANITSITIPKSITRIDSHVFPYCVNLREIRVEEGNQHYCIIEGLLLEQDGMVLHSCPPARSGVLAVPEGVAEIAENAFAACMKLTHVIIPESVTRIGHCAFEFCSALTSVTIPESVAEIGFNAFWNCSSLTDVTIPKNVKNIGDYAFAGCTGLTRIVIPEGAVRIGIAPFYGCTNLSEIRVEEGNQRYCVIDSLLLERDGSVLYLHTCPAARSGVLELPECVTQIAECAFGGCTGLTGAAIPGSVWEIGESAFEGCSNLAYVTIPEGVTYIGDCAFAGCTNLTHMAIPKSVCGIGCDAFRDTGMSKEAREAAYDQARENELLAMEAEGAFLLDEEWSDIPDDEV